jgi:hypothetical protein
MPLILGLTAAGALGYYFYSAGEVPLAKRMCPLVCLTMVGGSLLKELRLTSRLEDASKAATEHASDATKSAEEAVRAAGTALDTKVEEGTS